MKKFSAVSATAIIACALLVGCSPSGQTASGGAKPSAPTQSAADKLEQMETKLPDVKVNTELQSKLPQEFKDTKKIRVVMTTSSPPTHYTTKKGMKGVDNDLALTIGKALGVEVEVIGVPIDQVIPGFQAGKYDVVISQFKPSTERAEVLDFVDYANISTALAVNTSAKLNLNLQNLCGRSVAIQKGASQGTTEVPQINKECKAKGKKEIVLKTYRDTTEAVLALQSNRVDSVLADSPALNFAAAQSDGTLKVVDQVKSSPVSIGTVKGNGLVDVLQGTMQYLNENGAYTKLFKNWGLEKNVVSDFAINKIQE